MDKEKLLQDAEMIYREIAENDKRLSEDFLSISLETIEKPCNTLFPPPITTFEGRLQLEAREKH